mmetsp:Transcript_49197/g.138356  ORF Transcript_49197/g.138356 Transcript_49197/m.138356 type:complete len:276 (+) Transcript_49197:580-1407(+)
MLGVEGRGLHRGGHGVHGAPRQLPEGGPHRAGLHAPHAAEVPQDGSQCPLAAARAVRRILAVLVLVRVLAQAVVRQMCQCPVQVPRTRGLVLVHADAHEALAREEDREVAVSVGRRHGEGIDPDVPLPPVQEERPLHVLLDDGALVVEVVHRDLQGPGGAHDLDALALRARRRLHDERRPRALRRGEGEGRDLLHGDLGKAPGAGPKVRLRLLQRPGEGVLVAATPDAGDVREPGLVAHGAEARRHVILRVHPNDGAALAAERVPPIQPARRQHQ